MRLLAVGFVCAVLLLLDALPAQAQAPAPPVRGADALPSSIPLFPLDDLLVFPNIIRPLHIFEPRYRAMIEDALKGDRIIGMVQLRPGYEADYEGRPPVFGIGCAGVITEVERLPDGRFNLLLRGLVRFRILGEDQSRPYRLARVEVIPEEPDEKELAALAGLRERLLDLVAGTIERPSRDMADEDVINGVAQYAPLDGTRRQQLLELNGPLARGQALVTMLEKK